MRILAVDISGLFSQMWEVDSGKGRDFDKPRTSTLASVRRFREGHDRVAICCDSGKSFRSQIWESYKANRPARGEAYRTQIRYVVEALEAEGCSVFRAPQYNGELYAEADDVIGSLCAWAWESGHSVTILSSDKDLLQLVNPQVTMLRPLDKEHKVYDEAAVIEKIGLPPAKIPDFLALAGDTECWQGYKAHWTEMWAEAGLSPMINAGPAMQLQEAFDRTFVSDYVRCRACDEKRIASGSQEHLCVPHNRPQDLLCPCGGIREAYDCQDETWITEGPRNGDTDARVIPDVAALFDRTNGGSR